MPDADLSEHLSWQLRNCRPDGVRAGHVDCQGDKVALHAGCDVEGPGSGVHASHILCVGNLLHHHLHLQRLQSMIR